MAGLVPAICENTELPTKVLKQLEMRNLIRRARCLGDGRDKPGHDENPKGTPYPQLTL